MHTQSDGSGPPAKRGAGAAIRQWLIGILGRITGVHMVMILVISAFAGIGLFTFGYGNGVSYLTNNPDSCANCHIMQDHLDAWVKSSHKQVAKCNDCHLPHHPIRKWVTKGDNGFFHSLAFTTGRFHEPIQIKERNRRVTQEACLYCHADFVHNLLPVEPADDVPLCVNCHREVGHALRR